MPNQKIIRILPEILNKHFSPAILSKHVACAIGYGSGIFPQTSQPQKSSQGANDNNNKNTVDLIMIVKNPNAFHAEMHQHKPDDYSGLTRYLGSRYLSLLNNYIFPVHFNHTFVEPVTLKYAVVSLSTILRDLYSWQYLTFAGRLHKPVYFNILKSNQPEILITGIRANHRMALNVAILNMIGKINDNQNFPIQLLFRYISNISYAGDIRHTMAVQNVNKVDNIVKNNKELFKNIYVPLIKQLQAKLTPNTLTLSPSQNEIKIRYTPELVYKICYDPTYNKDFTVERQKIQQNLIKFQQLPSALIDHFQDLYAHQTTYKSLGEKLLMNGTSNIPKQINIKLGKINRNSSMRMAMENFLGASLIDNVKYVLKKIGKKGVK